MKPKSEQLAIEIRRKKILDLVEKNPGINGQEISQHLGDMQGTVGMLVKLHKIVAVDTNKRNSHGNTIKNYYINDGSMPERVNAYKPPPMPKFELGEMYKIEIPNGVARQPVMMDKRAHTKNPDCYRGTIELRGSYHGAVNWPSVD